MTTIMEHDEETTEPAKKFTTVHSRFQVVCSCCGLVQSCAKKREAIAAMQSHMDQHTVQESQTFVVYDLMAKGGGRNVYCGRIYGGIRSHGTWKFGSQR